MVRVISQGFSTPRSRHSSGEDMIDRFAAMKAVSAYNENEKPFNYKDNLNAKPLVIDCNTDTNDSFSGLDSEDDSRLHAKDGNTTENGNDLQDPTVMKKERRRQRNKLSAQNYRQRRRQQSSNAQKTLESLEAHNKFLLDKVRHLEAEKHIVEEYLRSCVKIPWCPYHAPGQSSQGATSCPTIPETVSCCPSPTSSLGAAAAATATATSGAEGCSSDADNGNTVPSYCVNETNNNNNFNINMKAPMQMSLVNNNMPLSMPRVSMETESSDILVS